MEKFVFKKQSVSRKGVVKESLPFSIPGNQVKKDGEVSRFWTDTIRRVLGRKPIEGNFGWDGLDVSGAGVNSPNMIVRRGDKFYIIPYNEAYRRHPGRKYPKEPPQDAILSDEEEKERISQQRYKKGKWIP